MEPSLQGPLLILFRRDTVPDDIREIHTADDLLTAKGSRKNKFADCKRSGARSARREN